MTYAHFILKTGRRGYLFELEQVAHDLWSATTRIYLAYALARSDIAARYRGSMLGPFWITLSMGTMILGIGVLYSQLFHMELRGFLPFVAVGIVAWGFIATTITDGCDCFVGAAAILRQSATPMFTFVWRTVIRNLMILAHHLIVVVLVLAWAGGSMAGILPSILGLLVVAMTLTPVLCLAGLAAARFRDVPQIVGSMIQFAMFLTPVFWKPEQVGKGHVLLQSNPFYYMLDVIRSPLLGEAVSPRSWSAMALMFVVAWLVALLIFARVRRRVVHFI